MHLKKPYIDEVGRLINISIKLGERTIEEVVADFCDEYGFITLKKMSQILEVGVDKLFECINMGKLQKYNIYFDKWIKDDEYEAHHSNVKNLISHDDFINFMIDECGLTYTKNYLFQDDQAEIELQNDLCYRKYDPAAFTLFLHPVVAGRDEIKQLLKEVLAEKVSLQSLKTIQNEPVMFKKTKSGDQPYGEVSIGRLGMVADHLKWHYPVKEQEQLQNKTSKRRGTVRLVGSQEHYARYRDIIYEVNRSRVYVRPLPNVEVVRQQLTRPASLLPLGWARRHMPDTKIKAEHCDTLMVSSSSAISTLYIDIQQNPKTRLHALYKGD